jgi:N-acyl-D-aspartate/D-glutamate deacylase
LYFSEVCKIEGASDPVELMCEMVHEANCGFVSHILSEADMLAFAAHEAVTVGSDASSLDVKGPLSTGFPHPRNFGTFPRAIRLFVREHKLYSLETAVRKYTYMPAQHIGLNKRGLLREGYWADVIVFDPDTITDTSTYLNSKQLATGVSTAIVNGVPVLLDGEFTGKTPGRPLRTRND